MTSKMTNTAKLKAAIVERGMIQKQVAKQIGISTTSFNYKLNNKTEFKASEIGKLVDVLRLTADKTVQIFFSKA